MSTGPQPEQSVPRAPRHRSPNHPALTLEDAITKATAIHSQYGRNPIPVALACEKWGYSSPDTSTASQALAAVVAFGLATATGKGGGRRIAISEPGERIVRNAPDRAALIRQAALAPAIHTEMWERCTSEGQLLHDDLLRQYLVWDRTEGTFNEESVGRFIANLRETLRFAGVGMEPENPTAVTKDTPDNGNDPKGGHKAVQVGSFVQWTSAGVDRFPVPQKIAGINGDWAFVETSPTGIPVNELTVVDQPKPEGPAAPPVNPFFKPVPDPDPVAAAGMAKEQKKLDEGQAILTWPDDLSQESVEDLEYWLNGVLKRARRKAGLPAE